MAIVGSQLAIDGTASPTTSEDTASVSPTGNALLLLDVLGQNGGGAAPDAPSSVTGNGLTWVQVATFTFSDGASETWRVTRFRAMGASPSTGAVTINHTTAPDAGMGWSLREYTGVVTTGSNGADAEVQTVTNSGTGTTLSATLAAFADAGNGADEFSAIFSTSTITPEAGWTGYTAGTATTFNAFRAQWRDDPDTTPSATISGSAAWGMIATEIAAAAGGGGSSITGEVTFSAFDLLGEASNIGVTVNPEGELVLSTFDLLADDFTVYVSGFSEIVFDTFSLDGNIMGQITAVVSGVVEFGTEMTLAAASTLQRIGAATLEFGVNLMGAISGGGAIATGRDLVRNGASFIKGAMRDVISRIVRRY